ncbi:C-C motif chemokine 27a [Pungitius pungitius]|uniref:C-C motif chemokine 27a n=1 Tax=Pungitius pungitius TaxID=134920 RepID=UPI0018886859|nr:C-C motif chemokine 27a [Pungitius pungitius]
MELKLPLVILCLCALAITSTEAAIPRCCIKTKKFISPKILVRVQRWYMQHGSDACDIPALVLHVKDLRTPVCAHPKVEAFLNHLHRRREKIMQKRAF